MKIKIIFAIAFLAFVLFVNCRVQGQSNWSIKEIPIPSRWTRLVDTNFVLAEYPRPTMRRDGNWSILNGLWEYVVTKEDSTLPVKYDGKILVPFPIESALSGVKRKLLPSERLWYKTKFHCDEVKRGQRILLHFGAVDWQAVIYINGTQVGQHTGGYSPFSFDITEFIVGGTNTVVIKVFDPTDSGIGPFGKQSLRPGSIFYTATSGIWQTVWMEKVNSSYIKALKITPDIDRQEVKITVSVSTSSKDAYVIVNGPDGTSVRGTAGRDITIKLTSPHLWTPNDPHLYDLAIKLFDKGSIRDEVKSYFGMRKVAIQKDQDGIERIFLNNHPIFCLGVLDQGFWPDGLYTAPADDALKFDLKAIKAMGFNTVRKHIKVEPERWYYYADSIGLLVWQDFVNPNTNLNEEVKIAFETEALRTIEQCYNHPSVITWVLFNEKWGQYDQKRLTEWIKEVDSTRIVDGHSGELLYVDNKLRSPSPDAFISSDVTDVHSYPYPRNAPEMPGKARVLGEFGGVGVPIAGHVWDDLIAGWGYNGTKNPSDLLSEYESLIDSVANLRRYGLTAAIYTQPFDVESEQNGLVTYDREVAKISLATIRRINSKILPEIDGSNDRDFNSVNLLAPGSSNVNYVELINWLKSGQCDSAKLRSLLIMATNRKDTSIITFALAKYLNIIRNPFTETNAKLIFKCTVKMDDYGFSLIFNNMDGFNNVMGENASEHLLMRIISKEAIDPYLKDTAINWTFIEQSIVPKYGDIARERLLSTKVVYYLDKKDWKNYGKYYKMYFDKVLLTQRNNLHINNVTWPVFLNIDDKEVLNTAIKIMQYDIENIEPQEPDAIDTYANLLYKVGRKREALAWQFKAMSLSTDPTFKSTYDRMKKNEITWK